jgi:flagellar protein FlbD
MDTVLQLTRLGGPVLALNPDLIERAEATPDTVVTLVNGSKYVIRESLEELTELIREYRADIIAAAQALTEQPVAAPRPRPVAVEKAHTDHSADAKVVALHPGER